MAADFSSFLPPSPEALAAQNVQDVQNNVDQTGGSAATKVANGTIQNAFQSLVGNPQLAKQNQISQSLKAASVDSDSQAVPGESDTDADIRRLRNMYTAVAPLDPQTASRISDKLVTLQQQKLEQARISQQTSSSAQDELLKRESVGTFVVGSADGTKEFGTVHRFNDDGTPNPDFGKQVAALQKSNPGSVVANQQQWFSNKAEVASQKAASALQVAQLKAQAQAATGLTDDGVKELSGESVFNPNALNRYGQGARAAVANLKAAVGISPADEQAAQIQKKLLEGEGSTASRRAGNIAILENSISGAGDQVMSALQGVTRKDMMALNSAIAAGKTEFSDPNESRYAVAIQGLVNEYSRVISGGGSQTTVDAAKHANELLNKAQGPAAVAAVVQQLRTETNIVKSAANTTLEELANPQRYGALLKVQKALGIKNLDDGPGSITAAPSSDASTPATGTGSSKVRTYNPATGKFS